MIRYSVAFALAAFAFLTLPRAGAQTATPSTTGVIAGRVIDSASSQPIGRAVVDVRKAGATAVVASATTTDDGSFRIERLASGRYTIRVRSVGYTPRPLPTLEIGSTLPTIDVGTVYLNMAPVRLQSLNVIGQKQDVQLAPDRNTYVVHDMPTTRGGTALDVLRNVPSVDVDIDNIVSLR